MFDFIKKMLGNKSQRDIKGIAHIVEQIHLKYERVKELTTDELRQETINFRAIIAERIAEEEAEVQRLTDLAENDPSIAIDEKEDLFKQIDQVGKKIDAQIEEALNELLPAAFAVMKETERRFKEQEKVEVTAHEMDHNLAGKYDNVNFVGDKAA